jgi:HEAT repeat protein
MMRFGTALLLVALTACSGGDDPGPSAPREPAPDTPRVAFRPPRPTEAQRLAHWVDLLSRGDRLELEWAIRQLATLGERAIPEVARALRAGGRGNSALVENAMSVFEAIGSPRATPEILPWWDRSASQVRERILVALAACGGAGAEKRALAALDDAKPRVVARALKAIHVLRPEGAVEAIAARWRGFGPGARALAVEVLDGREEEAAGEVLREILEDGLGEGGSFVIAVHAASALRRRGEAGGLDRIAEGLPRRSTAEWVTGVEALLVAGHPAGRRELLAGRSAEDEARRSAARDVSRDVPEGGFEDEAVAAIASRDAGARRAGFRAAVRWLEAGSRAVERALIRRLDPAEPAMTRTLAADTLVRSGKVRLLDRVVEELRQRPGVDRSLAGFALGAGRSLAAAGPPGIVRLRALLEAKNTTTVLGALAGIGAARATEAAGEVARLLRHEDPVIRRRAAGALGAMGTGAEIPKLREAHDREAEPEIRAEIERAARRILASARA